MLSNVGGVKCQQFVKHWKPIFKRELCDWLQFSIQSSDYGATAVAKISLYCKFWLCLEVETDPCIAVKQTS